jgi:hypothetical protein
VPVENLPKKLTNLRYTGLLSIIAESEIPLSAYQIFKRTGRSKYVYEKIKELTGIPREPFTDRLTNPKYRTRSRESNPEYQKEYERKMKAGARGPTYVSITGDDSNPSKWKYSLNFRGFLLYIVGEARAKRQDKRRLRKFISNPAVLELAPFLQYWQDFEKSKFDVIGTLREIGIEFQNLLTIHSIEYLQRRATETYFFAVDNYFGQLNQSIFFHNYIQIVDRQTHMKLKDYRLKMYSTLNEWYKKEIELNNEMLRYYSGED